MFAKKAHEIRRSIIKMLNPHESHHIGCSLSIVEILIALYFSVLKIHPQNPKSSKRDIFILSKGHAAGALYAILAERGFFNKKFLNTFERDGGYLPGHVTRGVSGVEVSTGSLGHGLSTACGFAISFRNDKKINKVFVLISDGELNEGSTWEAIMFAGHHKLHNLTVIIDANGMQGYGLTKDVLDLEPLKNKLEEFRWNVYEVDGHNTQKLISTFKRANKKKQPKFVIARTIKGKGIPYFEGKFDSHYLSIDEETKQAILNDL